MQRNEQVSEFKEKLVAINRVSKTVKGGRNMRFSAAFLLQLTRFCAGLQDPAGRVRRPLTDVC